MSAAVALPGIPPAGVAAFDVGGTDTKIGLVHADGSITDRATIPTPRDPADPAGAVVAGIAAHVATMPAPAALGVVVPGIVDDEAGVGVLSANLGWRDAPIRADLTAATGLPVGFNHDVTAHALAEAAVGAARGARTAAVVAVGTGIAAGLLFDGVPHRAGGRAGELGHSIVDPEGPPCACGARGCLEAISSAGAIARAYAQILGRPVAGAKEVLDARADDPRAVAVWDRAVDGLAAGLRQLAAILAPEVIVIGGGLMRAGDELFVPLRERCAQTFGIHPVPRIVPAQAGPDAGLIGAAIVGAQRLEGR